MGFSTLTARYPGRCRRCELDFPAGTVIRYGGRGLTYHLKSSCVSPGVRAAMQRAGIPDTETLAHTRAGIARWGAERCGPDRWLVTPRTRPASPAGSSGSSENLMTETERSVEAALERERWAS